MLSIGRSLGPAFLYIQAIIQFLSKNLTYSKFDFNSLTIIC
jgi:hypothetical protein